MHDLHVANRVQKLLIEEAKKNNFTMVKQAVIELGTVIEHGADITPENLEFNIKMLSEGTVANGLEIIIKKVQGSDWKLVSISGE